MATSTLELTDDQWAEARTWLPWLSSTSDRSALQTDYQRTESLAATVRDRIRARLMAVRNEPTQFTLPGDYSQSTAEQVRSLERALAEAEAWYWREVAGGSVQVGRLVRGGRNGRP